MIGIPGTGLLLYEQSDRRGQGADAQHDRKVLGLVFGKAAACLCDAAINSYPKAAFSRNRKSPHDQREVGAHPLPKGEGIEFLPPEGRRG